MMYATKIKMKPGCGFASGLLEIHSIYLTGNNTDQYYTKEALYDYLEKYPNTIKVNITPYPVLVKALSSNKEKYVKSSPDNTTKDNLLNLPRG